MKIMDINFKPIPYLTLLSTYIVKVVAFVQRLYLNLKGSPLCMQFDTHMLQSKFSPINVTTPPPPFLTHCQCCASNFFRASLIYFFGSEVLQFRALRIFRSRRTRRISPIPIGIKASWQGCNQKAENDFQKTATRLTCSRKVKERCRFDKRTQSYLIFVVYCR